jgi:glucose/arabinose dehydrogenase
LPTGLAWRKGALYVAAVNRILRYDDIDRRLDQPPAPVMVTDSLPKDTHHGWKFIAFGPDGKLYVPSVRRATSARPAIPMPSSCA